VAEIPDCPNFIKKRGCSQSNVILLSEGPDAWVFHCKKPQGCGMINVVSKDGVRDKSKFDLAAKRRQEAEEMQRRWDSRRKIFA
jgi:hypothetical protein